MIYSFIRQVIRKARKNQALEHATLAVLMEKGTRAPLGGYSTAGGYIIFSRASTDKVSSAAKEALGRLKQGQKQLAVSPYCGTNIATSATLAYAISTISKKHDSPKRNAYVAVTAIICGLLISRPLGNAIQRHYTTLVDPDEMEITSVRNLLAGTSLKAFTIHKITTGPTSS